MAPKRRFTGRVSEVFQRNLCARLWPIHPPRFGASNIFQTPGKEPSGPLRPPPTIARARGICQARSVLNGGLSARGAQAGDRGNGEVAAVDGVVKPGLVCRCFSRRRSQSGDFADRRMSQH